MSMQMKEKCLVFKKRLKRGFFCGSKKKKNVDQSIYIPLPFFFY
jgi:hypothetical protein